MGPVADFMRKMRTDGVGEDMVLNKNIFVEEMLGKMAVARPIDDAAMAVHRAPYATPKSRLPTLQWPREIPIGGDPADVFKVVELNNTWFLDTNLPKLFFYAEPGGITSPEAARWIVENTKNIEARFLGIGIHFLQEDHPHQIGQGIADWLRRLS